MKIFGVLLALSLFCCAAQAQDSRDLNGQPAADSERFGWADVLRVDPVYNQVQASVPQQECYEEQVPTAQADSDSSKRTGATVLGAIIGGIVGNRFGKGNGRKVTTAAGAVAGGVVGNNIAANSESETAASDNGYSTQRHCRDVETSTTRREIVAYDVEFRYRGEIYSSRLNHDPGDRMRVKVSVTPAD